MNRTTLTFFAAALLTSAASLTAAQNTPGGASVRVVEKQLLTYPYSQPRLEPEYERIYPYHRYDAFTDQGQMQSWEMVELENDYIKLWVMPAVGGKVWGAVDKKTGREFIYFNHVVKFRDVAMRGPWTSGGIEFNFGVVGHSPWCSDEVDYALREYPDGSVSCTVGAKDLALETDWRVEVYLAPDRACFETRVLWFNGSGWDRPAYQWMNSGVKTAGNLEYIFPGSYYLEHDGQTEPWPTDKQGHRINWYEKNDFGGYKSYHVAGQYTDFWGAYWHEDGFGMGHTADYGDKPGKKVWIWGLSDQGMIWDELLTDADGQYSELQAGRHLNQTTALCYLTPYKHAKLTPYTTAAWTEYWYPVEGTGGILYGSPELVFNVVERDGRHLLILYAVSPRHELLRISTDATTVTRRLDLQPGQLDTLELPRYDPASLTVTLDGRVFYTAADDKQIARPRVMPDGFDHESAYGLYLRGRESERQFYLADAAKLYRRSLTAEPHFVPALTALAGIAYERDSLQRADSLLRIALAVDTYDGAANYLAGLVFAKRGDDVNARETLSLATQSPEYGGAACTELGALLMQKGDYTQAEQLLRRALESNPRNLTALEMLVFLERQQGATPASGELFDRLVEIDPINHLAAAERYLANPGSGRTVLTERFRGPYWFESYLSVIETYSRFGRSDNARTLIAAAPEHPKITYWQAALFDGEARETILTQALAMDQSLLFPWRKSEVALFTEAYREHPSWQIAWQVALAALRADNRAEALRVLNEWDDSDFYPYFTLRASLERDSAKRLVDLQKARSLAPREPRTALLLADALPAAEASALLEQQYKLNPRDYTVGLASAAALSAKGDYAAAIARMKALRVLPCEGAQEGRELWREANIRLASEQIAARRYKTAAAAIEEARRWPRNLGVGMPYPDMIDERVEDFFALYTATRLKRPEAELDRLMGALRAPVDSAGYAPYRSADLLTALALRACGEGARAEAWLGSWLVKEPQSQPARWSAAVFAGRWDEAAAIAAEEPRTVEAMPYVTIFRDRDYPLLLRNAGLLKDLFR